MSETDKELISFETSSALTWLWRRSEQLIFEDRLWVLLGLTGVLLLVKDGLGYSGAIHQFLQISHAFPHNPGRLVIGEQSQSYLLSSPIGPAVGHLLGARSKFSFAALHLIVALAGVGIMVLGLRRRGGRNAVGVGVVLFFACSLSNVVFTGLGEPDAWTFCFASMLVLFDNPFVLALAGAGLGLSHPEVGIICVAAVGLLRLAQNFDLRNCLRVGASALAFVVGFGATALYERHAGGTIGAAGSFIRSYGVRTLLGEWLEQSPTWIWTTFGAAWWWLVATVSRLWERRYAWIFGATCLVATLITLVTTDETRVFVLITWPVLLWTGVRAVRELPEARVRSAATSTFLLAVVVPKIVVLFGGVYVSTWSELVTRILKNT